MTSPARRMKESTIERAVASYAKARGWEYRKQSGPGHRGKLVKYFFRPVRELVFVEFKAPGEKPSKLQQREIRLLRLAGFEAYVINSIEDGKRLFDR